MLSATWRDWPLVDSVVPDNLAEGQQKGWDKVYPPRLRVGSETRACITVVSTQLCSVGTRAPLSPALLSSAPSRVRLGLQPGKCRNRLHRLSENTPAV